MIAALLLAALAAGPDPREDRKIVLLAGPLDTHPKDTHEYEKNVILLKHLLETSGLDGIRVETVFNGWPKDESVLDDADTIFMTSGGCDHRLEDHPLYVGDRIKVLERQMKRGCGFVQFHWSTFNPVAHHDRITEWTGGTFDYETGPGKRKWYSKISTREWDTAIGTPGHPITRGVKPFRLREEFYYNIRFRENDPRLKPILLHSKGGDVRANTVGWAVERKDGGRGFGFTGGHFTANWWNPDFRKLVLNAIVWSAGMDVPEGGVVSALDAPARALIVTGHNHPAHDWRAVTEALIHALEQDPRLRVDVTEDPERLAGKNIEAYALLVMNYNNWDRPGLSDAAKRNLVQYLKAGGGLSLIHFANGAFNESLPKSPGSEWEEYRTRIVRRAWMHPRSGHDKFGPFRVTIPEAGHPITRGLAPFQTIDELYFRQEGDLPITPLAVARSTVTGKDEPMAWADAYGTGRVFQTVLGHAAVSVHKAAALIRRGSVWAAGVKPLTFDPPAALTENARLRRGSPWTPKKPKQEKKESAKLLPADPGLDGGKGGHWGLQGEEDWKDGRWNQMDVGPFVSSLLATPGGRTDKGLSIRLGDDPAASICYDTATATARAGWTGGFIAFDPTRWGLIGTPRIVGKILFSTKSRPAWGSLPVRFHGFHVNGRRITLAYTVGKTKVLESPWAESTGETVAIRRTFEIGPSDAPLRTVLVDGLKGSPLRAVVEPGTEFVSLGGLEVLLKGAAGITLNARSTTEIALEVPPSRDPRKITVVIRRGTGPRDAPPGGDLAELTRPGPRRWGEPLVLRGTTGRGADAYLLDTIPVPFRNPWKALMFLTGLDFFANGDAAVCTVHGDVWLVRGIDETLERVTWQRYATGLHQPLGLRIVEDRVHVLGRDRITRLHDRNGDGEADFYENFYDGIRTGDGHKYVTCLETDAAGNFYYVDLLGLHRVSPDGRSAETIATGWRHPNGMSVGPDGTITVAPQEGEWTPASMVCEVKPGDHYGFGGPKKTKDRPLGYDPPLCYIPRLIDNSTGGQVWVTSDRWGPLKGRLFNLSFGRSSMQLLLREKIGGEAQAAVVPLPIRFASGAVRGRFHGGDGQLYVVGMRGWVSNAVRDGSFQRVRYTGGKVVWPVDFRVHANGVKLSFAVPLRKDRAESLDQYAAEQWNYRHTKEYGSKDYSPSRPDVVGHDAVEIRSARLLADGKSVFLEIPGLRPVMQLRIRYGLKDLEGTTLRGELTATVKKRGPAGP